MPYITVENRDHIDECLQVEGIQWVPASAGELNYCISKFVSNYVETNKTKYAILNEMVGALECAKLEIYRMLIAPYEDVKIKENGSVF